MCHPSFHSPRQRTSANLSERCPRLAIRRANKLARNQLLQVIQSNMLPQLILSKSQLPDLILSKSTLIPDPEKELAIPLPDPQLESILIPDSKSQLSYQVWKTQKQLYSVGVSGWELHREEVIPAMVDHWFRWHASRENQYLVSLRSRKSHSLSVRTSSLEGSTSTLSVHLFSCPFHSLVQGRRKIIFFRGAEFNIS